MMKPVKVLIVDDSELIRSLLTSILSSDPKISVVGTAADPLEAREKIKLLNPDVITLDIEMPRMDGITFLKNLMRLRPTPVIMISTLTEQGAEITLEALDIGAIDFVTKPRVNKADSLLELSQIICDKVKYAAQVNLENFTTGGSQISAAVKPRASFDVALKGNKNADIIAIGASTGGTVAIKEVLSNLPPQMPPIVMVQHMPESFTASFADRLNKTCPLTVLELNRSGTVLEPGHAYLARGSHHMKVSVRGNDLIAVLDDSGPVNGHRPSVNVLFDSVAKINGIRAVGALLTGMGSDGATGLGRLKQQGAITIAQDETSSVVWGMPRVAIRAGAADVVLPLNKIGDYLVKVCFSGQSALSSKVKQG